MSWETAKEVLKGVEFPEETGKEVMAGETHVAGKRTHSLKSFKLALKPIEEFSVEANYNVCPDCGGDVRNKYLVMFDNENNQIYRRWFIRHGEVIY